jgi:hypothetical protein
MCFGASPALPEVRYSGPSQSDIDANNAALQQYRDQSMTQQQAFATQLQKQIDDANSQAAQRRAEMEAEMAAATASAAAQQTAAYATTVTQSTDPMAGAQVTSAVGKKDKSRTSLKITPGGATSTTAGSGLNIGV